MNTSDCLCGLPRIKNAIVPLSISVRKYGAYKFFEGVKILLFIAALTSYFLLIVATKDISPQDQMKLCELLLDINASSHVVIHWNGAMLMVKMIVLDEKLISSEMFQTLVTEILAIRLMIADPPPSLQRTEAIMSYFTGSGPIYSRTHTFKYALTEEMYTVSLLAYERRAILHIYTILSTLSLSERRCDGWRALQMLCNAQATAGSFKVTDTDQVIFEYCITGFDKLSAAQIHTHCDYISKQIHCFKGPICSFIDSMTSGGHPNPARTLLEAMDNLKHIDQSPELQLPNDNSSLSLGANVVLTALLNRSSADSEDVALVVDAVLHDNSVSRALAFALEVSNLLKMADFSREIPGFWLERELDGAFLQEKYVDFIVKSFKSQKILDLLQNRFLNISNCKEKHSKVIWAQETISFWQLCCNLSEMYISVVLSDRANIPKTISLAKDKQGQLIALLSATNPCLEITSRKTIKEAIKLLLELNMRRLSHMNFRLSTIKTDSRKRICLTNGYYSVYRIPAFSQAASDPLFCQEIDFIPPEIGQIMLIKDDLIHGDSAKISDLQALYTFPPDQRADSYSFGTFLYYSLISPILPRLSPIETESRLRRAIFDEVRPIIPNDIEYQQPQLADLINRCWGEKHTRPSISSLFELYSS
jgi:hypothetical protein